MTALQHCVDDVYQAYGENTFMLDSYGMSTDRSFPCDGLPLSLAHLLGHGLLWMAQ